MAQPPSPHAITGNLSRPGNLPRSSGRKTTWPGEPRAGSDMTLYGPGIAFGAPSSGSVVLTRSALGPGAWANETHAVRTNAVVSADFMRCSLADGNTTGEGGWLRGRDLNSTGGTSAAVPTSRKATTGPAATVRSGSRGRS